MKVFPDDLLFSREHVWVRVDGHLATIGITDYAQEKLGVAVSIELPEVESYLERDEPFGTIEAAAKGVTDLVSPVSGEVVVVNEDLLDDIGVVNSDPHDTGWMIVVEMEVEEELDDLLDLAEYNEFLAAEAEVDVD
jgi:glycine cleavage system H protein